MSNNIEFIYNWDNEQKNSPESKALIAATNYKEKGYESQEAFDLLLSDNYSYRTAQAVINKLYDSSTSESASHSVSVVPTCYEDVKDSLGTLLRTSGPDKFINILTKGAMPLIKMAAKPLGSLRRVAEYAMHDNYAMNELHKMLKPWVEDCLLNSVLLSEKISPEAKIASVDIGVYEVTTKTASVTVDLFRGASNSERFTSGNFETLGLPDEYVILVAEKIAPLNKIKKDLSKSAVK